MKETVKDYVPVDSESVTHNMWVLLMFRSVMVHTQGIIEFLGRTISQFQEPWAGDQVSVSKHLMF